MTMKALLLGSVMALGLGAMTVHAQASTISVGEGWVDDTIESPGATSDLSPVTFTLGGAGVFSLSDGFIRGDVYTVTGSFTGVSTFTTPTIPIPLGIGDTSFDSAFYDDGYSHLQVALSAGTYTISIAGDGAGGTPAGFGYRVDLSSVPLPASLPMFGGALLALAGLGYGVKRKSASQA